MSSTLPKNTPISLSGSPALAQVSKNGQGNFKTYHNEKTEIYKKLSVIEQRLQDLTNSIQKYEPNPDIAADIVQAVDCFNSELDKIQTLHEMRSNQIIRQNAENDRLNMNLRTVLTTLDECHQELARLPDLSVAQMKKLHVESIEEAKKKLPEPDLKSVKKLLAYAMKLSKFSRIPQTFDGFLLPNNFLWPGDDNMRRGMLAMASMYPDRIIEEENRDSDESNEHKSDANGVVDGEDEEQKTLQSHDDDDEVGETSFDHREHAKPKDASEVMAGLDLFDEDEDDDM